MDTTPFRYAIIVNTNEYTGNFEREFCAYTTGAYGECEVGQEEADSFVTWGEKNGLEVGEGLALKLFQHITALLPDEHGCHRPVAIYDEANSGYHDLIIYLDQPLSKEAWEVFEQRAAMFGPEHWPQLIIHRMRMIERAITVSDAEIEPS